jgi:hypothetical protein
VLTNFNPDVPNTLVLNTGPRGDSYHEHLHDHHEYRHDLKTDHYDNYHALEHEYRHDITEQIRQTRSMQHEYHKEMEHEHKRQISINNDIGITY